MTRLQADGSWLGCWQGQGNIIIGSSGANAASCAVGTGDSFPEGKVVGHEADYHPPSSAKVNKEWS